MIVLLGLMITKDPIQYPTDLTDFQVKNIPIARRRSCARPRGRTQAGGHSGQVSPIDSNIS